MTETLNERLKSPVTIRELERRTAALQQAMKEEGIDCVIAQNITQYLGGCNRWLTDTTAENNYPQSSILPQEGVVRYIACSGPPLDLYPPSHLLRIGQPYAAQPYFSPFNFTHTWEGRMALKWIKDNGAKKVGIAGMEMFYWNYYKFIKENAPEVELVDISDMFDKLRAVKSEDEKAFIRKAADIQDKALSYVQVYAQDGVREYELRSKLMQILTDHGGEEMIVTLGSCPQGEKMQLMPAYFQNRTLRKGDMLFVKLSTAGPGGMFTTVGRLYSVGCEPSAKMIYDFEQAKKAEEKLVSMLEKKAEPEKIFEEYNAYLEEIGCEKEKGLFSYSQGYDHVERPSIQPGETMAIEKDMMMCVNVRLNGAEMECGYISDSYLIGDGKAEKLHKAPVEILRT